MRLQRMSFCFLALALWPSAAALAQESYTIARLKEAPPKELSGPVRETLQDDGYKVVDAQGKTYAEIWLRKHVPAKAKPGAAQGQILFPFLAEGELLGALRFPGEGHDYRDQSIGKGVYTLRYGLQPVNGDHLGVSPNRDYMLLLPAGKDATPVNIAKKPLEERSAESAGTSHPAVLMLVAAPASSATAPAMSHDAEKNTWGAVVPLNLKVKDADAPASVNVQLIVVGVAAT
jgi:hypothetical protein